MTAKASPDMDGTLTVKATNEAGTAEDSAKVSLSSLFFSIKSTPFRMSSLLYLHPLFIG